MTRGNSDKVNPSGEDNLGNNCKVNPPTKGNPKNNPNKSYSHDATDFVVVQPVKENPLPGLPLEVTKVKVRFLLPVTQDSSDSPVQSPAGTVLPDTRPIQGQVLSQHTLPEPPKASTEVMPPIVSTKVVTPPNVTKVPALTC